MINRILAEERFKQYVSNYDSSNSKIIRKIEHSYRVSKLSKKIAGNLKLPKEEISLAQLIGLLHDIGRFEQVKKYNTFKDYLSVDHADLGVEILKKDDYISNYCNDKEYKTIILESIRNHNKYKIDPNLKDKTLMHAKIIRDADKIDILNIIANENNKVFKELSISKNILESFYKKKLIKNEEKITKLDYLIGSLALVFDMNFNVSFEILQEKDYLNKIADKITVSEKENIKSFLNKYISERV